MLHLRQIFRSSGLNPSQYLNKSVYWKQQQIIPRLGNVFRYSTESQGGRVPSVHKLLFNIKRFGRAQLSDITDIFQDVRSQQQISDDQAITLIKCCGNMMSQELPQNRQKLLEKIWTDLFQSKVDIKFYNALLQVYIENDHKFSPYEFVTELKAKSVVPDRLTCKLALGYFFKQGDFEGATQFAKNVFNFEFKDMDSPTSITQQMKKFNLYPDTYILTSLLCNHAKNNQINSIAAEVRKSEIKLEDEDFFEIFYTLSINGHKNSIDRLWRFVERSKSYNRHAVRIIQRLINCEHDDVALKIFQTMVSSSQITNKGQFFISHMIKMNYPLERIIEVANVVNSNKSTEIVFYELLKQSKFDACIKVLRVMQENAETIREHYFWPIICGQAKNGKESILNVVKMMNADFDISPSLQTIYDYIIPQLKIEDPNELIAVLEQVGISRQKTILAVVYNCLSEDKLRLACDIAENNRYYYYPAIFRTPLSNCLVKTGDVLNYSRFVNIICKSEEVSGYKTTNKIKDPEDLLGEIIVDAIVKLKSSETRDDLLEQIFTELANCDTMLSKTQFDRINSQFGSNLTETHRCLLLQITSKNTRIGDEAEKSRHSVISTDQQDPNKSKPKLTVLHDLIAGNRLKQADEMLNQLEEEGHHVTTEIITMLINNHALNNNSKRALYLYEKKKNEEDAFYLNGIRALNLANALIVDENYNEAHLVLRENQKGLKKIEPHLATIKEKCLEIMNLLEKRNEIAESERFYNNFVSDKLLLVDADLSGPLMRIYLKNEKLPEALKLFQGAVEKHRVTPSQHDLFCKLIENEDVINLEKVTDLSMKVHGEIATLCRLAFAFIACKRSAQAKTILQQLEAAGAENHVKSAIDVNYRLFNDEFLEEMLVLAKDLTFIDRSELYDKLLSCYRHKNSPADIVNLYNRYCQDNQKPPLSFQHAMRTYLESVNHPVPSNVIEAISNCSENDEMAEDVLLEKLTSSNELDAANKNILEKFAQKKPILRNVLKFHLGKVSNVGDVNFFNEIEDYIVFTEQMHVKFWKYCCRAHIHGGQAEKFIDKLTLQLERANCKPTNLNQLRTLFPYECFSLLESNPELIDKFERLAARFAMSNIYKPFSCLWLHYFLSDNELSASEIWTKYLESHGNIAVKLINEQIVHQKDACTLRKLIAFLETQKIAKTDLRHMYKKIIQLYTQDEQYEQALAQLQNALKYLTIESFDENVIEKIKSGLSGSGIPFTI